MESLQLLGSRAACVAPAPVVSRRGEWSALLTGAVFSLFVSSFLQLRDPWLFVYGFAANVVMFGLMALAIYDAVLRNKYLAHLVSADLALDLFDRPALMPLARWGQSVTLTFVGGTCLSLLFQSYQSLYTVASVVIYSILVAVALILFFTSTWSIHVALVAAQDRELADVRKRLETVRRELKRRLSQDAENDAAGIYRPAVVLGLYEKQVLEASTWPFNPKIVKELVASAAAPVLIYAVKIAVGMPSGS